MPTTSFRTCPLCEATCGLEVTVTEGRVTRIRGDRDDLFSKGFICPKGSTLGELHEDPDRLRRPQIRRGDTWSEVSWEEAFAEIERRLQPIREQHGNDAVAVYLGNPNVHGLAGTLYVRPLVKALGTHNVFSASTVDQMPKHVSSGLMFGHPLTIPVPDIDRTDYLLMMGANPKASNGSLATAPDWPGRMTAIRERGGKVVVIDPRRTESAELADEHLFIRPGSDAAWLAAVVTEVLSHQPDPGRLAAHTRGLERLSGLLADFEPEAGADFTGIPAAVTRRIAAEFAAAPTAVAYGRLGTHAAAFGTLASWLTDVLNLITGNLDRPGGAMFARSAAETPRRRPFRTGRWSSRVRQHPEALGELPVAALAEEILTPGDGQVRALVTVAGNPARSTPDSGSLTQALESLEFMVAVDPYRNETTRHADVILPPPSHLERSHYDLAFWQLSVRNVANYSPPTLPVTDGRPDEWQILLRLTAIASGLGADADVAMLDEIGMAAQVGRDVADPESPISGQDPGEIMAALEPRHGPERILDYLLRTGPYGDAFGAHDGLTLAALEAEPHGIDLGPLEPRLPELLSTADGLIDAAPETIITDLPRLRTRIAAPAPDMVVIGRRHLRSNNSWMHNVPSLMRGRDRSALLVSPADAARFGLSDGGAAVVESAAGTVTTLVAVSEEMMPGVASLPHGWGHDDPGASLSVASRNPGANLNALIDAAMVDAPSGNAVLNGVPVTIRPA
ncbi:MAG TPA: molybdopterin-dependent oxidoreductase [Acidimicrobiia bacterium]|nr:molybdopterin-dependent oxidoreductase [Acidimicrobiia bacterium]